MSGWSGQSAQALARDLDGAVVVAGVVGGLGGVVVLEREAGQRGAGLAADDEHAWCAGSAATALRARADLDEHAACPRGASISSPPTVNVARPSSTR